MMSTPLSDTLRARFTAFSDEELVLIITASVQDTTHPVHFYVDDYALREGWTYTTSCDPANLLANGGEDGYRYGFNGQEQENELNPSITSAEYWMYDGRLGRRWNVDPVTFPWQSSYATFDNSPVYYVDPLGLFATKRKADKFADKQGIDKSNVVQNDHDKKWSVLSDDKTGNTYDKNGVLSDYEVYTHKKDKVIRTGENSPQNHFLYSAVSNFPTIYDDTRWGMEDKSKYHPWQLNIELYADFKVTATREVEIGKGVSGSLTVPIKGWGVSSEGGINSYSFKNAYLSVGHSAIGSFRYTPFTSSEDIEFNNNFRLLITHRIAGAFKSQFDFGANAGNDWFQTSYFGYRANFSAKSPIEIKKVKFGIDANVGFKIKYPFLK